MSITKAMFKVEPDYASQFTDPGLTATELTCMFNPKDLKISGGGEWSLPDSSQQSQQQPAQFKMPKPRTMNLTLLFDEGHKTGLGVVQSVDLLFDWTKPRKKNSGSDTDQHASAALLRLFWPNQYFKCYISNLSATYSLFKEDGTPIRAQVQLTLSEAFDAPQGTNPTSGGPGGERIHQVIAGDSLHSIAYRYYGKPHAWRALAAHNGIDDPMRLRSGATISVPQENALGTLS